MIGPAGIIGIGAGVGAVSSAVGTLISGGTIGDAAASMPAGALGGATAVVIAISAPMSAIAAITATIADIGLTAGLGLIDVADAMKQPTQPQQCN